MHTTVIIAAAGKGKRMVRGINKQYLELEKKPILLHTLEVFDDMPEVDDIIVVIGEGEGELFAAKILKKHKFRHPIRTVVGGAERQDSIENALKALTPRFTVRTYKKKSMQGPARRAAGSVQRRIGIRSGLGEPEKEPQIVLTHDGARPLVDPADVRLAIQAAREHGAAILAVPVKDTIKVASDGFIQSTPVRSHIWAAQTPQVFQKDLLLRAYREAKKEHIMGTDDAMLLERLNIPVKIVPGSYENIKITTPEDIFQAEQILRRR